MVVFFKLLPSSEVWRSKIMGIWASIAGICKVGGGIRAVGFPYILQRLLFSTDLELGYKRSLTPGALNKSLLLMAV